MRIGIWSPSPLVEPLSYVNNLDQFLDCEQSPFFLRDSRASETRARMLSTPREKDGTRKFFTRARVSLALVSLRKNGDYSQSNQFWAGCSYQVGVFFMSTRKVILYNLDIGKCDVSGWPVRAIVSYGTKTIRFLEDGEKTFSRRIYCKTKRDTC